MHHPFFRCLLLATVTPLTSLFANDTSLHDGRFGPEPLDGESPVRMVAEQINVAFGYRDTAVHCRFVFRNTGAKYPVVELVGFPDIGAAASEMARREPGYADTVVERVNTAPLRKLETRVDGKRVRSMLKFGNVARGKDNDGTAVWSFHERSGVRAWHTVAVTFPPARDVIIERSYTVQNGASALGVTFFHYTTATGAVWRGTIGRMQAEITLKDGLTVNDLIWPRSARTRDFTADDLAQFSMQPPRAAWTVVDAKHLRLVWTNFEPRTETAHRGFTLARPFHGW
jgi:hypothetical protein